MNPSPNTPPEALDTPSSDAPSVAHWFNRIALYAVGLTVVLVVLGGLAFVTLTKPPTMAPETTTTLLRGVPAYNITTHQGQASFLAPGSAALASVFTYWSGEPDSMQPLLADMRVADLTVVAGDAQQVLVQVATENGYNARVEVLTWEEVHRYLGEDKTPLLFMLRPNTVPVFAEPMSFPAVLIGVDDVARTLTFHSYWFGPTYELTQSEFATRHRDQAISAEDGVRYEFVVIQPSNLVSAKATIAARAVSNYPERPVYMDLIEPLVREYINGFYQFHMAAWAERKDEAELNRARARLHLEALITMDGFALSFPRFFKVMTWATLAEIYLTEGQLDTALSAIERAVELNHDLDQTEGHWPGVELPTNAPEHQDAISKVERIAGDVYRALGHTDEARRAYSRALEITPGNQYAERSLTELENADTN